VAKKPGLTQLLLPLAVLLAACGETPAGGLRPTEPPSAPQGQELLLLSPRRVALSPISEAGDRRVWRSEGNIALATEGARVVATAGLPRMVMATRFDGADPLDDPRALLGREAPARRTVDLGGDDRDPGDMRFGVTLDCALQGRMEAGWILVEERCQGDGLAFTNRFWADPATGAVRRSEQWAGEGVGMLALRMPGT
jgi:hypothetical protein